jgi:hypothetical protein
MVLGTILVEHVELYQKETIYNAYETFLVQTIFPACSYDSMPYTRGGVNWYLVCVSYLAFDNARIIPFTLSLSLIPITFLVSRQFTGNNLVGLMSAGAATLDPTMLIFNTSSAFGQTWAVFALLSIYLMQKNPLFASSFFWASTFAKALSIALFPAILYTIIRKTTGRKRIINLAGFGSITGIVLGFSILNGGTPAYSAFTWNDPITMDTISRGFQWISDAYRWSWHVLLASIVSVIVLYKIKKLGKYREVVFFNLSLLAAIPVLTIFTNEGYFPYRIFPNLIFGFIIIATAIYETVNPFKRLGINQV